MRRRVLAILTIGVGLALGGTIGSLVYAKRSAAYQRALLRKAAEQSQQLIQFSKSILFFAEAQWLMEQRKPAAAAQVLAESDVFLPGYAELARGLLAQGVPIRTVFEGGAEPMHILPSPDGKKLWISRLGAPSEIIFTDGSSNRIVLEGERESHGAWTRDSLKVIRRYDERPGEPGNRKQCIVDITTGKNKHCFPFNGGHSSGLSDEASFDGRLWAYRLPSEKEGKAGVFRLFDSETGADLYDAKAQKPAIFSDIKHWAFHPKEYRLAIYDSKKKVIRIADATSGTQMCASPPLQEPVEKVLWSFHGRYVAAILPSSAARVWDAIQCSEKTEAPVDSPEIIRLSVRGPALESWMPIGKEDIVYPRSGANSQEPSWIYQASALAFPNGWILSPRSPNEGLRALFRPSGGESVYIKHIESNTQRLLWSEGSAPPSAVLWSHDENRLFSISGHTVYEWNPNGTSSQLLWRAPKGEAISTAAFSPDGTRIAAAVGNTLRIFEPDSGQRALIEGNSKAIQSIGFADEGRVIVARFTDGETKAWDSSTREKTTLTPALEQQKYFVAGDEQRYGMLQIGDTGGLRMIPISPAPDSHLHGHNPYSREQILARPGSGISYAAWSPEGDRIVGLSKDGTLHLWAMSPKRLRIQLQQMNADCMPAESRIELLVESTEDANQAYEKCKRAQAAPRQ